MSDNEDSYNDCKLSLLEVLDRMQTAHAQELRAEIESLKAKIDVLRARNSILETELKQLRRK